jgi:5'-deoxynucleotidase YfbR-like HD superfamily hydrolase
MQSNPIPLSNILTIFDFYKVTRKAHHKDGRPENDAEHSWSASYLYLILKPQLEAEFGPLDSLKIQTLFIIHDLGELIIGDIPTWLKVEADAKKEIPIVKHELVDKMGRPELFDLYMEMESKEPNIEVQIVKSIVRIMPVLMRVHTGLGWHDVEDQQFATRAKLDERSIYRHKFSKTMLSLYTETVEYAVKEGYFPL